MAKKQTLEPEPVPEKCVNHPQTDAVLTTDGGGAFQTLHLCKPCIPAHWR